MRYYSKLARCLRDTLGSVISAEKYLSDLWVGIAPGVGINMAFHETENPIEQKAVAEVWKYLGIKGSKLTIKGETGYPDRIYWLPGGKPFLVEYKRPGEDPREKQIHIHTELMKLDYDVEVHDDPADTLQAIINRLETTRLPKESRKILDRARMRCAALRSRPG